MYLCQNDSEKGAANHRTKTLVVRPFASGACKKRPSKKNVVCVCLHWSRRTNALTPLCQTKVSFLGDDYSVCARLCAATRCDQAWREDLRNAHTHTDCRALPLSKQNSNAMVGLDKYKAEIKVITRRLSLRPPPLRDISALKSVCQSVRWSH